MRARTSTSVPLLVSDQTTTTLPSGSTATAGSGRPRACPRYTTRRSLASESVTPGWKMVSVTPL
jgi:hypothetical protein